MIRFADRGETRADRRAFAKVRRTEIEYGRKLRQIATMIGNLINGFDLENPASVNRITATLERYAQTLKPWAESVATLMLEEATRRDDQAWAALSRGMARDLRAELRTAPIGGALRTLMGEQVDLITSLPLEAAERVHREAIEALSSGERPEQMAKRIAATGEVTTSRANTIARTETGRASSTLTMIRAKAIDSPGYFWRTSKDANVRPSHRAMEGKFVAWDDPPTLDNMTGHAGALINCRCYSEVSVPDL